jgi:hypothetical protein
MMQVYACSTSGSNSPQRQPRRASSKAGMPHPPASWQLHLRKGSTNSSHIASWRCNMAAALPGQTHQAGVTSCSATTEQGPRCRLWQRVGRCGHQASRRKLPFGCELLSVKGSRQTWWLLPPVALQSIPPVTAPAAPASRMPCCSSMQQGRCTQGRCTHPQLVTQHAMPAQTRAVTSAQGATRHTLLIATPCLPSAQPAVMHDACLSSLPPCCTSLLHLPAAPPCTAHIHRCSWSRCPTLLRMPRLNCTRTHAPPAHNDRCLHLPSDQPKPMSMNSAAALASSLQCACLH